MVYYFIPRHVYMIGSHRGVREHGRKPKDSRTTRRRLGRDEGREEAEDSEEAEVSGRIIRLLGDHPLAALGTGPGFSQ